LPFKTVCSCRQGVLTGSRGGVIADTNLASRVLTQVESNMIARALQVRRFLSSPRRSRSFNTRAQDESSRDGAVNKSQPLRSNSYRDHARTSTESRTTDSTPVESGGGQTFPADIGSRTNEKSAVGKTLGRKRLTRELAANPRLLLVSGTVPKGGLQNSLTESRVGKCTVAILGRALMWSFKAKN